MEDSDRMYYYKGDAYHDIVFATQKIAMNDEFCLLNTMYVTPLLDWVFSNEVSILDEVTFKCGSDVQSHDSKGSMGLRIDGVQGLTLSNINIHDISNDGDLGMSNTYFCDEYETIEFLTVRQTIEPGYTGTRSHGIIASYATIDDMENINISNIKSKYGSALGISIYQGTTLTAAKNIEMERIAAGWELTQHEANKLALPNYTPRACGLEIGMSDNEDTEPITVDFESDLIDENSINAKRIFGYDVCADSEYLGTISTVSNANLAVEESNDDDYSMRMIGMKNIDLVRLETNENDQSNGIRKLLAIGLVLMVAVFYAVSKIIAIGKSEKKNGNNKKQIHNEERSPLLDVKAKFYLA